MIERCLVIADVIFHVIVDVIPYVMIERYLVIVDVIPYVMFEQCR